MAASTRKNRKNFDFRYTLVVLWGFAKRYRFLILLAIGLIFAFEAIHLADSFLFKFLVDKAALFSQQQLSGEQLSKLVVITVLAYLLLKLAGSIIWFKVINSINNLEGNLMNDIERKSFWHIINLSYRFHTYKRTGSLISQFTRGVSRIESFADSVLFNFVPTFFRVALSFGVVFYFDVYTSLVLLLTCLVFVVVAVIITHLQEQPQEETNEREDALKHNLGDVFFNIETVKYFAKEKLTFSQFSRLSQALKYSRMRFWNYFSWFSAIETFVFSLGLGAITYLSFIELQSGRLTLGEITLIYSATLSLLPALFGFTHGYRNFMRSAVDVSDLFTLFKEKNEVKDVDNASAPKITAGEIGFRDVNFTYPQRGGKKNWGGGALRREDSLLENFTLHIRKNTKVALIGPSGSGKTTVVRLLYRLFDLNSGEIFIDGQDIKKVTQQSLRESMSIVPQEPILFNNTLYFNIAYANPRASRAEVWKAIRMAELDKFISRLPLKEETLIGERGVKLSGGEKQRVSIARALLANKRILVMDEATSSLDSETEKEIHEDLEKLMENRTTLIIAHRLSTVMSADLIVGMEKGRIVEQGTHAELLQKKNGLYRRLWELQRGKGRI
ncbi:MAG: ABC transporter ATP-binding protein [Nanoarchaeota archaeon]